MKNKNEFLIETDIFLAHLTHRENSFSQLEVLLQKGICFASSATACELFFLTENEEENHIIKDLLSVINVLGYHSRYSLSIGKFNGKVETVRDATVCTVAKLNKLPIVCINKTKFLNAGIPVFTFSELELT